MSEPDKAAESGRTAAGTFAPGNRIGASGRPRGIDIRRLAEERAKAEGMDLEGALWLVIKDQLALARIDTAAAKLMLSTLGDALTAESAGESLAEIIAATINKNRPQ